MAVELAPDPALSLHPLVKAVRQYGDDRGYSYFPEYPLTEQGQINYSVLYPGVVKAFHWHKKQWDHWVVLNGMAKIILARPLPAHPSPEELAELRAKGWQRIVEAHHDELGPYAAVQIHHAGERNPMMVSIPPGVLHGYTVEGPQPVGLLYHVTLKYDPRDPDEWRFPWDGYGKALWEVEFK